MAEILLHPWMKAERYSQKDLEEEMKIRLEVYSKICKTQIQEKVTKQRWGQKPHLLPSLIAQVDWQKAIQQDSYFTHCIAECSEITAKLGKPKQPEAMIVNPANLESLSDDQVNSGSASEDSFKGIEEDPIKESKEMLESKRRPAKE